MTDASRPQHTLAGAVAAVVNQPGRTLRAVAGAAVDTSLGATANGLRRTGRVAGWVVEHLGGRPPEPPVPPWATGV